MNHTGTVKTLNRDTSVETEFGKAVYRSPARSELTTIYGEMYLEIMEVGEEGKKVLCIRHHIICGTLCV